MSTDLDAPALAALRGALAELLPAALDLRRRLHREPALSGDELGTLALVESLLPAGADVRRAAGGAVVKIGTGDCVAVRAELDALPVDEATGVAWGSAVPGVMHACGHDVHLAALWAVLHAWASVEPGPALAGILQPREETYPSGALDIVASGLLTSLECRQVVGVHVQPALPAGVVACVPGAVNASSDEFTITMLGRSGHSAYPHRATDPVIAIANLTMALQSLVSRSVDPMDPVVVGVSMLQAGHAANTIPERAVARGTIRTLSSDARELVHRRLVEIATSVAQAHGCEAQVELARGEPVLVNDRALAAVVASSMAAAGLVVDGEFRSVGSDDFSYYCEIVPSVMVFVGTEARSGLHSSTFLPTEADLALVAEAMLVAAAAARPPANGV